MIRIFNIIFFLIVFTFVNSDSIADTKIDCSKYGTKTFESLTKKLRCLKGLPPLKNNFFESLKWKKDKSKSTYEPGKPCNEYSTKTFASLAAKMKCLKNK